MRSAGALYAYAGSSYRSRATEPAARRAGATRAGVNGCVADVDEKVARFEPVDDPEIIYHRRQNMRPDNNTQILAFEHYRHKERNNELTVPRRCPRADIGPFRGA